MERLKSIWKTWDVVIIIAAIKLLIHLYANTLYGFHRDEFLYLDEANHLAWGYMEVPPMIAVVGKLAYALGGSLFVIRLMPTLIGLASLFLIGAMVKEMGGKKWAIAIACIAYLVSPTALRNHLLFQPVAFNQFFWILSAFTIIRLIKYDLPKYWYHLGIIVGLGILTKYSIDFFVIGIGVGLVLTPHRKWLRTPHPYLAALIALSIAAPNLHWQYQHNFPVVRHMSELASTQLVNVSPTDFILNQFLMQFAGSLIWLGGLIFLFQKSLKKYRVLAWTYLTVIGLLIYFSGKDYYALGAYPMLFAVGGIAWATWLKQKIYRIVLMMGIVCLNFIGVPYGIPIFKLETMEKYCEYMADNFGLDAPIIWEDGQRHSLPQDYADMHGWKEMVENVATFYHRLPATTRSQLILQGGSYGHAGAINHYRRTYNLPEAYSYNSSYILWLKEEIGDIKYHILVDDNKQDSSSIFNQVTLIDSTENPYARDPGYIYFRQDPKVDLREVWKEVRTEVRAGILE